MASKTDKGLALVYDNVALTLSTLGASTALSASSRIDGSRENGFRIIKTQYWLDWIGKTAPEGPLIFGISFGLSVAQIAACITADPQSKREDFNVHDTALPVFPLALIPIASTGKAATPDDAVPMREITLRWSAPEGTSMNWFVFNADTSALTTGTSVVVFAKHFGVWLND